MENTLAPPAELERMAELIADRVAQKLNSRARFVNKAELSRIVGLSPATIDRRTTEGLIPKITIGRRVLYDPDAVLASPRREGEQ